MATLFGTTCEKDELLEKVGDLSQVAGIRMMELSEGREAGVHIAEVRTGSGLRYQVTLDRGMDVSIAEYKGIPLAWRSPAGDVHPAHFDPRRYGWLRSFPGGLMTGCGMTFCGAPCTDEGEELGLHGRLSHLPAAGVKVESGWQGSTCMFRLAGDIREYTVFNEHLLLHRVYESALGESVITIRDTVTNEGHATSPLMMLYHINLGWPVVAPGSRLFLHARGMRPRDAVAAAGVHEATVFSRPIPGYKEQVFYHDLIPDHEGYVAAVLANSTLDIALSVRYRQRELPRYAEWKMMGQGTYVVGMEPANCCVEGRAKERSEGTLQFIEPGEQRVFFVQIGILEGKQQLTDFIQKECLQ